MAMRQKITIAITIAKIVYRNAADAFDSPIEIVHFEKDAVRLGAKQLTEVRNVKR